MRDEKERGERKIEGFVFSKALSVKDGWRTLLFAPTERWEKSWNKHTHTHTHTQTRTHTD